jgi:hypothetical protein
MAGIGVDEPGGRGGRGRLAPPAPHLPGDVVQVSQRGVAFGVHDRVHFLRPADHPELSHALVSGDHDLHAGPARLDEPFTGARVPGPARAEERLVALRRHRAVEAERDCPRAAPDQWCLAPGGVVLHSQAGMVI